MPESMRSLFNNLNSQIGGYNSIEQFNDQPINNNNAINPNLRNQSDYN